MHARTAAVLVHTPDRVRTLSCGPLRLSPERKCTDRTAET